MKVFCQKSLKQGRKYHEGRAFCISSGYYLGLGTNNLICCLSAGLNSYSAPGPDTIGRHSAHQKYGGDYLHKAILKHSKCSLSVRILSRYMETW